MTKPYHAFLLRCWQESTSNPNAASAWRFSLEDAHSRQRRGFASLEELITFLEASLTAAANETGDKTA
ncbi:MAG: hypothetical protein H6665_00945 [Ardenticatenaceae bacterium]|nr:hypothetical protein [Ardenticatenaceae bacterium]MCB8989159.1 hypothetical protein [Ardenticatenaceae bacterium]